MSTDTKFKKFWVMSVNNWICDADYSGKELKARCKMPSFRKFYLIKSEEEIDGFTKREELTNREHINKLLGTNF